MGEAVGAGAVVALDALGAAVGGAVLVGADLGAASGMGVGADIVERRRALGGLTREKEVGYGSAHAASPRPHTWAAVGAPENVCYYCFRYWRP